MKLLYYDCFCGINGQMNLGALIDLGVNQDYLISEISKINLPAEYEIMIKPDKRKGISGTRVDIIHDDHSQLDLNDIPQLINAANLSVTVKKNSLAMFDKLAQAEKVHFPRVGTTGLIIDIVGAAICLDYLKVDRILASSVQVGGGLTKDADRLMPVPAPATVELLKGVPIKFGLVAAETTTPTGAAILAANVEAFTDKIEFSIEKIGYGIGHSELAIPHVLRVYLGQAQDSDKSNCGEERKDQYILETNIDDMNPEIFSYVEEKLFARGALDVFKSAIWMKKSRPAVKLSVLFEEKNERAILDIIFRETTALGVRKYPVEKIMLQRDFKQVPTRYGTVTVKNAYYHGELVKSKPEYDDCQRIAGANSLPIGRVYREVFKVMEENEK